MNIHGSPSQSESTQRLSALVVALIAAAFMLAAFVASKACGCDERTTGAVCLAAGVVGLALGAAVCR